MIKYRQLMPKNLFIKFLFLLLIGFTFSCQNRIENLKEKKDLSNTDFIYLNGNYFELRNEKFFPVMLNYIVSYRNINNEFILTPHIDYEEAGVFETHTKGDIIYQLNGHFQLIKEMGFNTIRVCFDRINNNDKEYYYKADGKNFFINADYEQILNGLETFVAVAAEKELRIMLLVKPPWMDKSLEDFTLKIFERFKDNPVIFAYDLMNEPLYFSDVEKKEDAYKIVSYWHNKVREYAPNQLFTIGFSEPIEVNIWDAALLPVDFVAFHTYHPLRKK